MVGFWEIRKDLPTTTTLLTGSMLTTDNCFDAQDFCTFWDAAYGVICDDHYSERIMGSADHGWALDALLDRFLEGMTPAAAVAEIVDGYDPTP